MKINKQIFLLGTLLLLAVASARATLYTQTFTTSAAIPDGSPLGTVVTGIFNNDPNTGETVGGLTVGLNISGGYDGNLYAYLVAPNGTMVVLLNQPGVTSGNLFGNAGSGMNLTLADGGAAITASSDLSSGTYSAVGTLVNFDGSAADGTWTLFFADLANGGGTSTLNSWSLGITAVPEPIGLALGIFAGLLGLWWWLGRFWTRPKAKVEEQRLKLDQE